MRKYTSCRRPDLFLHGSVAVQNLASSDPTGSNKAKLVAAGARGALQAIVLHSKSSAAAKNGAKQALSGLQ